MAVKVRVDRGALYRQFVTGGQVHAHSVRLKEAMETAVAALAPTRSGALARSIKSNRVGTNGNGCNFRVYSKLEYAPFVDTGTSPIIWGKTGPAYPGLVLYQDPGRFVPAKYRRFQGGRTTYVLGQRGKFFFRKGMNLALATFDY